MFVCPRRLALRVPNFQGLIYDPINETFLKYPAYEGFLISGFDGKSTDVRYIKR